MKLWVSRQCEAKTWWGTTADCVLIKQMSLNTRPAVRRKKVNFQCWTLNMVHSNINAHIKYGGNMLIWSRLYGSLFPGICDVLSRNSDFFSRNCKFTLELRNTNLWFWLSFLRIAWYEKVRIAGYKLAIVRIKVRIANCDFFLANASLYFAILTFSLTRNCEL